MVEPDGAHRATAVDAGGAPAPDSPLPPPPPPGTATDPSTPVVPVRAGHLTMGWRVVTACTWAAVIVAFAAIWNTSVQLGLSTWWLGPRGQPQPQVVRLLPFVAPLLMCLAVFNNMRRVAQLGLIASGIVAVFGIVDLWYVPGLAVVELLVAAAAALVSVASFTGTYRADTAAPVDGPATVEPVTQSS